MTSPQDLRRLRAASASASHGDIQVESLLHRRPAFKVVGRDDTTSGGGASHPSGRTDHVAFLEDQVRRLSAELKRYQDAYPSVKESGAATGPQDDDGSVPPPSGTVPHGLGRLERKTGFDLDGDAM